MVKRVITGAHYGVRDWLAQRLSAAIMAIYTLALFAYVMTHQPLDYATWRGLFESEAVRFFSLLFALSLFAHAWVGVRDVLMDYVRSTGIRLALQAGAIVILLLYTMWTISILWGMQ